MKKSGFRTEHMVRKLVAAHDNLRVAEDIVAKMKTDIDQLNRNFGIEMKRYMDDNRIGVRKLARLLNKSAAYVSDIGLGRRHAPPDLRAAIMRTLHEEI